MSAGAAATQPKHFTDTELSAELMRQIFLEAQTEAVARKHENLPRLVDEQHVEYRRSIVVERFAHLPHATEASQ